MAGLTAGTLIDDADLQTYGHTGAQKISEAQLLRELSRQDRIIVNMFSQIAPDLLSRRDEISCADGGNQNGYTLEDGVHYRDFTHVDEDDNHEEIQVVQKQHQDDALNHPAGYLQTAKAAGMFFPADPDGDRWSDLSAGRSYFEPDDSHSFKYSYVPLPSRLTSRSDETTAPELARDVFTYSLELAAISSMPPGAISEPRLQMAMQKRQAAMDNLRMQLYKFSHPQGESGERRHTSDRDWVERNVS